MHVIAAALLVGLLAPLTLAAPTAEMILTPAGYRPATTVYEIPAGATLAHVGSEIHLISFNGTVLKTVTASITPTPVKEAVSALQRGWVTYATWLNTDSSPISSFTTTWTVPPVPATDNGQIIFLFNSIVPDNRKAILQPVLQYGHSAAGGGSFWAVTTWYNTPSTRFFTTPIRVSPGAILNGIITLTSSSSSPSFNYNSQFTNIPGTSLNITGVAQLTGATETLEVYGVTAKSDYPSGSTVFTDINLKLANGNTPSVSWAHRDDIADGLDTTIDIDGATNARIAINYNA
ncbi:hypothetical protein R3P38DRAFT_3414149 [Favolaschia claudopus]|uniref:Uncharacterized protein n=1 Tax=Favolaschia claudopus TaxID=2862362 RepID=A0AAV9YZZ0_9AGAR